MPLVHARDAQFRIKEKHNSDRGEEGDPANHAEVVDVDMQTYAEPPHAHASTSGASPIQALVTTDALNPATRTPHPEWSKRRIRVAKKTARLERQNASLPSGTHQLNLRSGRQLNIPHNFVVPDKYRPHLLLNKAAALDARPLICDSLVVGVNAVTRKLEQEIEDARRALANLPELDRQASKKHKQDSLRFFVPAPNLSTRKQRREMRRNLYPSPKRKATQAKRARRKGLSNVLIQVPEFLEGVPRKDVVLQFALQDLVDEIEAKIQAHLPSGLIAALKVTLDALHILSACLEGDRDKTNSDSVQDAGFMDLHDPDLSATLNTVPVSGDTVELPKEALKAVLFVPDSSDFLSASGRSILTSLLMRHDSRWFSLRNKVQSQSTETDPKNISRNRARIASNIARSEARKKKKRPRRRPLSAAVPSHVPAPAPGLERIASVTRPLQLVFVAKEDINPLEIVQHLLTATAARNSVNVALGRQAEITPIRGIRTKDAVPAETPHVEANDVTDAEERAYQDLYIVPLGKGAETRLANLLGIRRVSVIGFTVSLIRSSFILITLTNVWANSRMTMHVLRRYSV